MRRASLLDQSLSAGEFAGRQFQVGFALRKPRFGCRLFALSLCQHASRSVCIALCHVTLSLRFVELGREHVNVHVGDHLTGRDEISFIHELVKHAPRQLRRNIDLGGLDAPVAAGETLGELRVAETSAMRHSLRRRRPARTTAATSHFFCLVLVPSHFFSLAIVPSLAFPAGEGGEPGGVPVVADSRLVEGGGAVTVCSFCDEVLMSSSPCCVEAMLYGVPQIA